MDPRGGARPRATRRSEPFGSPGRWPDDDLIGVSTAFDADLALAAYASGVFPMPVHDDLMGWWSPQQRAVLPLDGLRVTRSLRKMLPRYVITFDAAFDAVLAACADPSRPGGWIDADIARVYRRLHRDGVAHSVEAWSGADLVGGLYGVSLGGLFAGESMFHDAERGRDASKAALVALVELLADADPGDRLLDVQWRTPHLASLGAVELARTAYLDRLPAALQAPVPDWAAAARRDTTGDPPGPAP